MMADEKRARFLEELAETAVKSNELGEIIAPQLIFYYGSAVYNEECKLFLELEGDGKPYFSIGGEDYFGNDLANQVENSKVMGTLRERCSEVLLAGERYFPKGCEFYEKFYLINKKEEDLIEDLRKKYCEE